MALVEIGDAFWMGVLEGVDRLVLVADDREPRIFRNQLNELLLGCIQVLVFVDKDVRERRALGAGRVVPHIAERLWDKLADQHRIVEPQPIKQVLVEPLINWIVRPPGLLALKSCPGRFEGRQSPPPRVKVSKLFELQIL